MTNVDRMHARYLRTCRLLIVACMLTAAFYLQWLLSAARPENAILFALLVGAEVFNVTQAAGFWYTAWMQRWTDAPDADFAASSETVDVFVTVCGEPADIVEQTVRAAMAIRHPRLTVWVLDDGRDDAIAAIARRFGTRYLTRAGRDGAKAGNINNALARATGDFVVIFDADHIPVPSFLERTMPTFEEPRIAFVQTPQSYRNRDRNLVAAGAHEQQALFYGPIMRGRDRLGAVFSCGTNVVFRREALDAVGGIPQDSVTEDLRVSLVLVRAGWKSAYLPEVLAEGLGPTDVRSYFGQQRRWARGGLEILFKCRPFTTKMTFGQFVQYGLGFLYWFNGWAYSVYIVLTLAFLYFGLRPVQVRSEYPAHFLPYVIVTLITIVYATGFTLTFRALWFTLASFPVHIWAFFAALFGRGRGFVVTPKSGSQRSLGSVWPHVVVVTALAVSMPFAIVVQGATPSVMNNVAFAVGHVLIVSGFVVLAIDPEGAEDVAQASDAS